MKISGIYKIQSLIKPNRIYIGSAVNIKHRWECHVSDLGLNKHHSVKLQRHYNKYGQKDLKYSLLLGCDKEDLIKIEQYFIDSYNPYFNNRKIADSNIGMRRSPESRKRMSDSHMGHIPWNKGIKTGIKPTNPFKTGDKAWAEGRMFSKEHKQKLSIAKKDKNISQKHKDKLSESLKLYWERKRMTQNKYN